MEILVTLLLIVGLFFVFIELLVPGFGIFGIIGTVCIILSWLITIFTFKLGLLIVLFEVIFISVLLYLAIKQLKRMQIYGKFILSDVLQQDKKDVGNMDKFVGREGVCKTDLRPFGNAEFNGLILEVLSDDGYIKRDSLVKVIRFEDNKLYVKLVNNN